MRYRNCIKIKSLLSSYMDGESSPTDKAAIEAHLFSCAGCRAELESLAKIDRALRRLDEADASPFFVSRVLSAARAATPATARFLWLPVTAMVAMLLFMLVNASVFAASLPLEMRGEIGKKAFSQWAKPESIINPVAFTRFCNGCANYMCDCLTREGKPHICMCKDCKMKMTMSMESK